jgi:hypothetical protein
MQGPFIRSAVDLGKAVFWVYGVAMPMGWHWHFSWHEQPRPCSTDA